MSSALLGIAFTLGMMGQADLAPLSNFPRPTTQNGLPTIPPATVDNTLEVTGERLVSRAIDNRMAVNVAIGAQGPFRFLVDSGADRTVVGRALADRLALPAARPVLLHGTAGSMQVDTVTLEGLKVGSNEIASIEAPALPEQFLDAQGVLGIDSLSGQRLLMDFDRDYVVVQDARVREEAVSDGEEIVVTARRRHGQLIITEARAGSTGLYAVIDSGANISIANNAMRAKIFAGRRPPPVQRIKLLAVTGQELDADLIFLPELALGGVRILNVPVAFADAPPFALFGLAEQPAVLLGTDLLRAFRRVSLDFRNRRVRFVLRPGTERVS